MNENMNTENASLSTQVLTLSEPIYHANWQGYYDDAMRTQAPVVVKFLKDLQQAQIDRHDLATIATYGSERINNELLYEKEYDRALARAIVDEAQQNGLQVSVNGFSPKQNSKEISEQQPLMDYTLKIEIDFDESSHGTNFQKFTSSYHRLNHTITIEYPAS